MDASARWISQFSGLRQWARAGERAPHKPLLLLYALARFQRDGAEPLRYSAVERDLRGLLAEFGPARRTTPAYPFHHLQSDGLWVVRTAQGEGSPGTGERALRESGAAGELAPELRAALEADPGLLERLVGILLERHFAPSLFEDIVAATGLQPQEPQVQSADGSTGVAYALGMRQVRRGAVKMRARVLEAYSGQCAFCGFDGRLGEVAVGLEAAHVRWWAFNGPDEVSNGLCLCTLHHRLFDKGVMGLSPQRRIIVSQRFAGHGEAARTQVFALAGRPLLGPGDAVLDGAHINWHTAQVYKG
ncbi:phosphorothioated DNA-binding restriction endonuclease [Streptomyces albipurpureus]|uniref:HNH endonuclease n=1 Tax=Streptomyces albipurpureus TaxID=2897419 RepID=A0ABT0URC8_9ACTN|nr:HNH endonuclease [Streptomyces sp. CWNU-1]MCM2389801.1 HNH endonuclease [Streptomyces sp. CWNU-1]